MKPKRKALTLEIVEPVRKRDAAFFFDMLIEAAGRSRARKVRKPTLTQLPKPGKIKP